MALSEQTIDETVENIFSKGMKPRSRTIYGGEKILKSFHAALGNDGFLSMLKNNEIFTNTQGADYVENFLKEQKNHE